VWAHRRNVRYPKVVMGGACGNSIASCCSACGKGESLACGRDCDETTIAYHALVSSHEPYYCEPQSPQAPPNQYVDVISCPSHGTFSKGAFLNPPSQIAALTCNPTDPTCGYSLYPPRADLSTVTAVDSMDVAQFASLNDLAAVSAATPAADAPLDPPILWYPPSLAAGDYVAWVELHQSADFNMFHHHPNAPDTVPEWNFEGHDFFGQPSVVYRVPFHYDTTGAHATVSQYEGYSTWDGSDGVLHPPDTTITDLPGTGAGRLLDVDDGVDQYRVKVVSPCEPIVTPGPSSDGGMGAQAGDGGSPGLPAGGTGHCSAPQPVTDLVLTPSPTSMTVTFRAPSSGAPPLRYSVRYHEGAAAIDPASFDTLDAGAVLPAAAPGARLSATLTALKFSTTYAVAVRGYSACNSPSPVVSQVADTPLMKFVTLHGCFIATAAYGSALASSVDALRRFRDRRLLDNPAGRLFVATYYAFSPPLARAIASDERLRALARRALTPLVNAVVAARP
jgi:hypothetical protein